MKVLIVVDAQNDFIDGVLGTPEAVAAVPHIVDKIKKYDNKDSLIIETLDTHSSNYLNTFEGERLPVKHCIYGTEGQKINDKIEDAIFHDAMNARLTHIDKYSFGATDIKNIIYQWCKFFGVTDVRNDLEIELVGFCTDICVISNALLLRTQFPSTKIAVDAQCCAGTSPEKHAAALEVMKSCMIDVI